MQPPTDSTRFGSQSSTDRMNTRAASRIPCNAKGEGVSQRPLFRIRHGVRSPFSRLVPEAPCCEEREVRI